MNDTDGSISVQSCAENDHAAPDGAWKNRIAGVPINMALLTELFRDPRPIPRKTARNRNG